MRHALCATHSTKVLKNILINYVVEGTNKMPEEAKFKCLRCGHEFMGTHTPKVPEERSCPKCASNSVRRIKEEK